jgi:hypothetical protein
VARKARIQLEEPQLACLRIVRQVMPLRDRFAAMGGASHGNTQLEMFDALIVMLAAFFNPMCRSLRLIEQLSQLPFLQGKLAVDRVCKSTLSDAFERFEPQRLTPLIEGLMAEVPHLRRTDANLEGVCKQVIAADGSFFNLAADVTWALHQAKTGGGKRTGRTHARCRLDLQIDVDTFTPVDLAVGGQDEGSEAAAFIPRLKAGVIYLVDRNFLHFGFVNAVLDQGSDVVLRLRDKAPRFETQASLPLCARDIAAGITSDRTGILPGSPGGRTGPPPTRLLREVILPGADGKPLRLLTSLLDVPAWVIAELYRRRWQIELFLRWLKVWTGMDHLISHGKKGITLQFYVAVIACLLMHLATGRKVNKYTVFLMGQVASGLASFEDILPLLDKVEREKEQERQRRAKKKLAKMPAQLPG